MACPYVPTDAAYLQAMLAFVDCQAQTIGQQGYLALAAPGSIASIALTGLLTIFVALIGYRLLLGDVPTVRDGVLTFVKIGIVLALATSWDAYRVLIYDVALRSPGEFDSAVSLSSGLPASGTALITRLGIVDQQLQALAVAGVGGPVNYQAQGLAPPLFAGFETFALGASRVIFLIGALGAYAATRLAAGILLALGPLFIAFLLFDGTRGLFEGWLRALGAVALGALATTIMLGVELAFLLPWLTDLVARRGADQPIPGVPAELLAVVIIFLIVLIAVVLTIARVAWGLKLRFNMARPLAMTSAIETRTSSSSTFASDRQSFSDGQRTRASLVVDAVAAAERRENAVFAGGDLGRGSSGRSAGSMSSARATDPTGSQVIGREASRRRPLTRVSASAERRDRR